MKRDTPAATPDSSSRNPPEPAPARLQMADVARMAGVSTATVSRALSGNPTIPEATRLRIAQVASSMGYRIHHGAANLRRGNTSTIGVVVLADDDQPMSDPFILGMVGHIADALNKRGQSLLLTRIQRDQKATMLALVSSGQVGGLLVIGQATNHQRLNELEDLGIPLVVWGAVLPDARYAVVGGDNLRGGLLATRHLLQAGARRIAFLGNVVYPEVKLRHTGYLRAHAEFGIRPDRALCNDSLYQLPEVETAINTWLDQGLPFDGVFATSDVAAANVIAALGARNIQIPGQVQLVGYDDVAMSAYIHPPLTTVRQPKDQAAEAMVDLLTEKMDGGASRAVVLPAELVVRKSTR